MWKYFLKRSSFDKYFFQLLFHVSYLYRKMSWTNYLFFFSFSLFILSWSLSNQFFEQPLLHPGTPQRLILWRSHQWSPNCWPIDHSQSSSYFTYQKYSTQWLLPIHLNVSVPFGFKTSYLHAFPSISIATPSPYSLTLSPHIPNI